MLALLFFVGGRIWFAYVSGFVDGAFAVLDGFFRTAVDAGHAVNAGFVDPDGFAGGHADGVYRAAFGT